MSDKKTSITRYMINGMLILLLVVGFGTGLLITALQIALDSGVTFSRPRPTPQAISLTYLPLPVVEITPMPRSGSLPDRGNFNSQVQLYTNRFGGQWTGDEEIRFYFVQDMFNNINIGQAGVLQAHHWVFSMRFPWPTAPFSGELTHAIRGSVSALLSPQALDHGTIGPAVAEFVELLSDPQQMNLSNEGILASCRHQVRGHITLTSYSPVVGHFQFACQFDATEYALVSGWFWE